MAAFTSYSFTDNTSCGDFPDGDFLDRIAGDEDGHLTGQTEEQAQDALSHGQRPAGDYPARLRGLGNTDRNIVFHGFRPFRRGDFCCPS